MEYLRELPTTYGKELRQTLVKGHDDKCYVIYTIQLYNFLLDDGRANFDTVVYETDADGNYDRLWQQYNKRYHTREEALRHHETILASFDTLLKLAPAKKKEAHAPAAAAAAPAAPAAPAEKKA